MTANVTTVSFAQGTAPVGSTAVFEIFIKATPERIWEAITDPAQRAKYSFGVQTSSEWTPGSSYLASVPGPSTSPRARTSSWSRRTCWCSRSPRCGVTT